MSKCVMTLNQIRSHSPCTHGWKKLLAALGKTEPDDAPVPLEFILKSNGIEDAIWCMRVNWSKHRPLYMKFISTCVKRAAAAAANAYASDPANAKANDALAYANAAANAYAYAAANDAYANAYDAHAYAAYANAYAYVSYSRERVVQRNSLKSLLAAYK